MESEGGCMRKEIQGMLRELPSLLTMRFQQVRCKDAILIRAAEENELSMTGAPKVIPDACIASGCTAYESFCNHFHLYTGKIKHSELAMLKELALAVGKNLYEKLSMTYPDGNFRLYVEINVKEGITLRFHQVWVGEKPVYSDEMIAESQSGKDFQVFLFASASEAA